MEKTGGNSMGLILDARRFTFFESVRAWIITTAPFVRSNEPDSDFIVWKRKRCSSDDKSIESSTEDPGFIVGSD